MAIILLTPCDGTGQIVVDSGSFTANTGSTYYITFTGTTNPGCFLVDSESEESTIDTIDSLSVEYTGCTSCVEPPRSAGTEVTICQETCDVSGTTVTTFIPPHPEWTDGYGTQVTQLNMIALGGPNGLNN